MSARIDTLAFFDALADEMNAHPDRYAILGDADMVAEVVMTDRPSGDFRVRLVFEGLGCTGVTEPDAPDSAAADFRLVGPQNAWEAMFADIAANGRATGLWTINSLALLGDQIACVGDDPMGLDKFSRFNQSLQEFLDGAGRVPVGA
jgi:hypothetical protein